MEVGGESAVARAGSDLKGKRRQSEGIWTTEVSTMGFQVLKYTIRMGFVFGR